MQAPSLSPARDADEDDLHALFCIPAVHRYLADGAPPPRGATREWITTSHRDFARCGVGLWLLSTEGRALAGCARIEADPEARLAELSYVLHPALWGRGLATRMGWSAMQASFATGCFDEVFAGADGPNTSSIAVMARLGMRFKREVEYPMGPGVEWSRRLADPPPDPLPDPITLR